MEAPINFDAMRIKIEFLFRTLIAFNNDMQSTAQLNNEEITALASAFVLSGIKVVHFYRREDQFDLSNLDHIQGFLAEHIGDKFTEMSHKIYHACNGLPITLTFGKSQLIIEEGMDDIMDFLKGFYEDQKEVSND